MLQPPKISLSFRVIVCLKHVWFTEVSDSLSRLWWIIKNALKILVSCHLWWQSCRTTCWYPQGRSVRLARDCLYAYPGPLKTSCWKEDNALVIVLRQPLVPLSCRRSFTFLQTVRWKESSRNRTPLRRSGRCTSYRGHRRTWDRCEAGDRP